MKKKVLIKELVANGFELSDKKTLKKQFDGVTVSVGLDATPFGVIYMINFYYNFNRELQFEDELLGGLWEKLETALKNIESELEIGALDTEWFCGIVQDAKTLKTIDSDSVDKYCRQFIEAVKPIIEEYEI